MNKHSLTMKQDGDWIIIKGRYGLEIQIELKEGYFSCKDDLHPSWVNYPVSQIPDYMSLGKAAFEYLANPITAMLQQIGARFPRQYAVCIPNPGNPLMSKEVEENIKKAKEKASFNATIAAMGKEGIISPIEAALIMSEANKNSENSEHKNWSPKVLK